MPIQEWNRIGAFLPPPRHAVAASPATSNPCGGWHDLRSLVESTPRLVDTADGSGVSRPGSAACVAAWRPLMRSTATVFGTPPGAYATAPRHAAAQHNPKTKQDPHTPSW